MPTCMSRFLGLAPTLSFLHIKSSMVRLSVRFWVTLILSAFPLSALKVFFYYFFIRRVHIMNPVFNFLIAAGVLAVGFVMLIKGADAFVDGSSSIA